LHGLPGTSKRPQIVSRETQKAPNRIPGRPKGPKSSPGTSKSAPLRPKRNPNEPSFDSFDARRPLRAANLQLATCNLQPGKVFQSLSCKLHGRCLARTPCAQCLQLATCNLQLATCNLGKFSRALVASCMALPGPSPWIMMGEGVRWQRRVATTTTNAKSGDAGLHRLLAVVEDDLAATTHTHTHPPTPLPRN
jgi:hypothetical protein